MLAQFLDSLEKLSPVESACTLPSHGEPFPDHRAVIRSTIRHHEERCAEIASQIAKKPMTAHELVLALWNRKLSAFHHNFAVFEILAHLEYMRRRGEATGEVEGATYWRIAA